MPRDKFIPNDVRLTDDARLDHPHRPEHGGQVDDPAPGRADRADGAGRAASCPRRARAIGIVRPRVHARRRERQPRARPVDVHGGDGGDERDPAHGDARSLVLLDEIGRGTCDVRRRVDRVGGERAPARRASGARRCSRRTTTSSTQLADELDAVRNYNVARARGRRPGALPAPAAAGRRGPLVRHRGRAARRACRRRCSRARARCSRCSRARARRWCRRSDVGGRPPAIARPSRRRAARRPRSTRPARALRSARRIRWSSGCASST